MWKTVIIDDDSQVLAGLKAIIPWEELNLSLLGEARDGAEGMELIREVEPDLVITDIYMPVMDGLEMIQTLTNQNEFTGKCIILSGYSDFEYARRALRLRIDEYLSKPTSPSTIREVIQRVTEQLEHQHSTMLRQEEIEDQLKAYESLVEREWLRNVVVGRSIERRSSFPSESFERKWRGKQHVVCVLAVHHRQSTEANVTDWDLLRVAARNIVGEIAKEHHLDVEWVELHSDYAALVIHIHQDESWDAFILPVQKMAADIIESISSYLKLRVAIGVGKPRNVWWMIKQSTTEAMQALKEPALFSELHNQIAISGKRTESINREKQGSKDVSRYYQQIAEAIRFGRREEAEQLLDLCLRQLESNGKFNSPDQLRIVGTEIWTAITYLLHHTGVLVEDLFSDMDLVKELNQVLFREELKEWLLNKIYRICSHWKWNENTRHRHAIKKTIEFVHNHYHEEISIHKIAEEVKLSRNYLGQLFMKVVGETFKSYLTRVRMEKAKQILVEGELLVYEVAEAVGYKQVPYFTKQFKHYFGCSPTELLKKDQEIKHNQ
ncbi:response regulator transcription factor [Shouchella shacheensis]|uniref:response regulator transcription factor n=1 Tax=Shouchella shacheensis TaxID=1649580 RepID=UPI00074005C9|nr:response regulator transcription factor [Shouchella shacheensis]